MSIPENKEYFWLSFSRDITTFFDYKREGLITWREWIKRFLGKVYFADLYWDEPKVMFELYINRIIKRIKKVGKKHDY